jgi:putative ABC transport system substrate-binding protein
MRRRDFIVALSGAVAAWQSAARAQQTAKLPTIGFLGSASFNGFEDVVAAFRLGLSEGGFLVGQNVAIEYRWAENHYDRLPQLAADLAQRNVAVIVASGGNVSALAAKSVTTTTPIIFTAVADPVSGGLVASMNRPDTNITGFAALTSELDPKRLELLAEMAPAASVIGALLNPRRPNAEVQSRDVQVAAQRLRRELVVADVGPDPDLGAMFESFAQKRVGAILIGADPLFRNHLTQIAELAARRGLPTIWQFREFPTKGGLASYGPSLTDSYRQAGVYASRILKGEKLAELPVIQPTKFDFVINLKTAKILALEISPRVLALADEVIE